MSSTEETELKAGHPPAEKIGGMRVSRPHHTPSGDKEEPKPEVEEEVQAPSEPKPNPHQDMLVSGAVAKEEKAFPVEAVKHYHDKPHTMPTNQIKHDKPTIHHIQQPR